MGARLCWYGHAVRKGRWLKRVKEVMAKVGIVEGDEVDHVKWIGPRWRPRITRSGKKE